jgi:hypothetical protein
MLVGGPLKKRQQERQPKAEKLARRRRRTILGCVLALENHHSGRFQFLWINDGTSKCHEISHLWLNMLEPRFVEGCS